MKFALLDFIIGFCAVIFACLGFSGIKALWSQRRARQKYKKVQQKYAKIDTTVDQRSDLDVLRKR